MRKNGPAGGTPIDPDDLTGLLPHITTQAELNEVEAENIRVARLWAVTDRRLRTRLLSPAGLCHLHRRMFEMVWPWAGRFRTVNLNIGADWSSVPEDVSRLCADVRAWIDYDAHDWTERAVRFHHGLVSIHPFPNGNGRHARLAADLLLHYNGQAMLRWGSDRTSYISALHAADAHDYGPLLDLIRAQQTPAKEDSP